MNYFLPFKVKRELKQSIGIIGAGPAGMACAEELRKSGYQVTIYDRYDRPGGLLIYGIPNFKLEKFVVERRTKLLKESGIKPKRSIRVVLFMNEENGLRGGRKYAEVAAEKGENHIFALESDSGGFTPRGFSFDCSEVNLAQIEQWRSLFKPYLIHFFEKGYSGADIGPLKNDNIVLAGLRPDSQRYFDHHHAANDTFDAVNKRELELGAATMTSLVYLFDKYGVNQVKNIPQIKD